MIKILSISPISKYEWDWSGWGTPGTIIRVTRTGETLEIFRSKFPDTLWVREYSPPSSRYKR